MVLLVLLLLCVQVTSQLRERNQYVDTAGWGDRFSPGALHPCSVKVSVLRFFFKVKPPALLVVEMKLAAMKTSINGRSS